MISVAQDRNNLVTEFRPQPYSEPSTHPQITNHSYCYLYFQPSHFSAQSSSQFKAQHTPHTSSKIIFVLHQYL